MAPPNEKYKILVVDDEDDVTGWREPTGV